MSRLAIIPTGVERVFGSDEIIVSKTDLTGHITYANQVFIGISGYEEEELLGAPHSIIRHPDMPRSVFKLLWDRIQSGNEIFAYVVNMAKNGDYYWVFAHVTPTFGAGGKIVGYHSNRRTPRREAVQAAHSVYDRMLAAERGHNLKRSAIEASAAVLQSQLDRLGATYDEWVWGLENGKVAGASAAVMGGPR
jgi:PAS domain S-box-containing protein